MVNTKESQEEFKTSPALEKKNIKQIFRDYGYKKIKLLWYKKAYGKTSDDYAYTGEIKADTYTFTFQYTKEFVLNYQTLRLGEKNGCKKP